MVSALAISSRLIEAKPARLPSWVNSSVSNDCNRDVSAALPDSLRTHEPEGWILCKTLGVVHVFIAGQATVARLSQQIRQWQLRVLSPPTIRQVFADEFT